MITIKIYTDEIAEILEKLAKSWRLHNDLPETANDSNGNMVCEITLDDDLDELPDTDPGICDACSGSGEGQHDGSVCPVCKGLGE